MNHIIRRISLSMPAACVLASLLTGASAEASDITYETRALTGTDGPLGPRLGAGLSFREVSPTPVLNGVGQIAFGGWLFGTGVIEFSNDRGIWSEGGGSGLALVARTGDPAPGTDDGLNFNAFGDPLGSPFPVINGAGQTAFGGQLTGAGVTFANRRGIWSEGGGLGLALVAREGSQAPGTDDGVNFTLISTPVLNGAGQVAFRASLDGAGVDNTNIEGIWSEGGGSGLALVARKGDPAPGTAVGVNFSNFLSPVINGAGQIAFVGFLTGEGVDATNDRGIWSEGGGSGLALVARKGDPAPGTAVGVNFSNF